METNDLAAIGYASQMLAFAVLSTLFLRWRTAGPYSRYLGVASAASLLAGGALTLQSLEFIEFGAVVVLAEWVRAALWIVALFMILRTLDRRRLVEKYARRYVGPVLAIALAGLVIYSGRIFDSLGASLVVSGGILAALLSLTHGQRGDSSTRLSLCRWHCPVDEPNSKRLQTFHGTSFITNSHCWQSAPVSRFG